MTKWLKKLAAPLASGLPRSRHLGEDLLRLHAEGLRRITYVIDGATNYDMIVEQTISDEVRARVPMTLPVEELRHRARQHALKASKNPVTTLIQPRFKEIACFGGTRNNQREFDFLDSLLEPIGLSLQRKNYFVDAEKKRAQKLTAQDRKIQTVIAKDISAFYASRETISAGLLQQQLSYSRWFFALFRAFTLPVATLPKLAVVANDHSASCVAFSMVMKGLHVPRVYLQHAEVTRIFPPLDFEYNVLRNTHSLDVYRQIALVPNRCFVIARSSVETNFAPLSRSRYVPQSVVLYPTARIDTEALRTIIQTLSANRSVAKLKIKRHPRCDTLKAGLFGETGVEVVDAHLLEDHVAIVGNSSMVIELLARGIPVYQCFAFDSFEKDYYGFVRSGLCPETTVTDMEKTFWTPYDVTPAWRAEFSRWVPLPEESETDAESLRKAISKLFPK